MTVASTTNRKSFSGDGVTTSFGTSPVVFYTASNLIVEVYSSTGAVTTLVNNTDYTVSGGSTTGAVGTVNLAGGSSPYGAPAVGETLLIRRVLPLVQEADFVNNDINDAEVSETALDKLTMIAQQISEVSGRGISISAVETATDALTTLPFDRASKFLAFGASKEMIASSGTVDGAVPVSTFMETVLDDTSAADARATLGALGATMSTARLLGRTTAGSGAVEEISVGASLTLSGGSLSVTNPTVVVQAVEGTPNTTYSSITTAIPYDDSIPQSGEGGEVCTVTITPTSASSRLSIEAQFFGTSTGTGTVVAVFQDSTASAIAAGVLTHASDVVTNGSLRFEMAAGTTSATTFKLRAGNNGGATTYVNGSSGGRLLGGVGACRIKVTEIKP